MASSRRVLVTGSSGLIGSETVTYFEGRGWEVHHICYISDLREAQSDYPGWGIEYSLDRIVDELGAVGVAAHTSRRA